MIYTWGMANKKTNSEGPSVTEPKMECKDAGWADQSLGRGRAWRRPWASPKKTKMNIKDICTPRRKTQESKSGYQRGFLLLQMAILKFGPQKFQKDSRIFLGKFFMWRSPFSRERGQTRGGPHKTPQEDRIYSTDGLFKPKKAILKLKLAIWKLKMAIRNLKTVILMQK